MEERNTGGGGEDGAPGAGELLNNLQLSFCSQQFLSIKVCSALREEFESQSQKRFEALNKKFIPLVVTDEPSRKVHMLMFILNDSNKTIVFNCRQITR